jgi:dienelactone hydrolase
MRSFVVLASLVTIAPTVGAQSTACAPTRDVAAVPVSAFAYDRSAPLDLRDSLQSRRDGVAVHRISFASPKGGRATGLLFVPDDSLRGQARQFAGLVVMHGAPGSAERMRDFALPVARHGAVIVAIDAPFARRNPDDPLSISPRDSVDQVQLMVDLQRAVDLLLTRRDVDPARLGYIGTSYGGAVGTQFAGIEGRVKTYVIVVGDGGLAHHFTKPDGARFDPPAGMPAERWCGWLTAMEPLNGLRYIGRGAPARFFFQWGRKDNMVPPHLADAVWAAAPEPKERRDYDSGHMLPREAYADMIGFLAKHLGTSAASANEVAPAGR